MHTNAAHLFMQISARRAGGLVLLWWIVERTIINIEGARTSGLVVRVAHRAFFHYTIQVSVLVLAPLLIAVPLYVSDSDHRLSRLHLLVALLRARRFPLSKRLPTEVPILLLFRFLPWIHYNCTCVLIFAQ